MFECIGEGVSFENIERIHRILDPILPELVDIIPCYMTGVADGNDSYNRVCEILNIKPYLKIYDCYYFDAIADRSGECYTDDEYKVSLREKNFLCFNKVHRQHRIDLLELMLAEKLITEKCYYSFQDFSMDGNAILDTLNIDFYPNINSNRELIKTLRLNENTDRRNPVDIQQDDIRLFDNSYFSLVTETLYYGNDYRFPKAACHVSPVESGAFFTEKTTKPVLMKHPFILVTTPNILRFLHDRGYKTFHPFIDETYDSIVDDDLRMQYIVNEVKRLSSQSNEEWLMWCENIKPIVEHNRRHFLQLTDYRA